MLLSIRVIFRTLHCVGEDSPPALRVFEEIDGMA